ncbi:glucose-1-phosphate adenylyltransferase [Brachybacterium alimentarium]|uniref:glucose-1-phosphate adenylyltransferase n=1 Tax=Brachybacterium alimentarium TaxID=47845 RepID=UPI000BB74D89|nr:glucose-1-phosphate adenylyltransferase [Brachybacterium alimentarium]PCC31978.1 glucose-1-phosphate adenylyltransferase [Brachybacterium alimentarium]RCS71728.1 glucose-1-phosphate adenylyltransferase [Brachybacterium alimentarium]RCS74092.1 glucose-1-phosphate adenylyltransferase [Brachybacterium alimentarium]RCS81733.1 glucose-1-phosphate adenylyltransferase [Brachybacterium alimentarium]RCS88918.1 glucose-1-phosphate adenylyltransferase [Brachybacterium alimentarium]
MSSKKVLAIVLAGGEGKRLMPLTLDRAKPAVPFGGIYRLIDFALSNIANSGYLRVVVLTQYKSHSLDKHIAQTWRMSSLLGNYVAPVPAQQRMGKHWYLGSADAIYQSLNLLHDEKPDYVVVVGADHVYRMDFSQMVDAHIESGNACTVAAIRQPIDQSDQFGVIETDSSDPTRITAFVEKPTDPEGLADDPASILASMGNYVFTTEALVEAVTRDAQDESSKHDMGGDIVPYFVDRGEAGVYDFIYNDVPGSGDRDRDYWRDVGTLDAFYDAHMDLIAIHPVFNLYNYDWPTFTGHRNEPPAKFVHAGPGRVGTAVDSIISPGVVISGAQISNSVVSPGVRLNSWSSVSDSVIMDGVSVGRHSQIHRAIIDKNVVVPPRTQIGLDPEQDRARGWVVTESGITVIGKGTVIEP